MGCARDDSGSLAVEVAIVFPAFIFLFLGVADFANYFHYKNKVSFVAFDTGRRVAIGTMAPGAASLHIKNQIADITATPAVSVVKAGGQVTVNVTINAADVPPFFLVDAFAGDIIKSNYVFLDQS